MTFLSLPAFADVSYDAASGLSGEAPVNKVGALLLASSIAVMSGSTISVNSASGQNELTGQIFKTTSSNGNVNGSAYFGDGPKLSQLDATSCSEYVELKDGSKVNGPVSGVTPTAITCNGQSIPMSSVASVHAARVFNFSLKTGSAPRMSFSPTCAKVVAQAHKSGPHRSMRTKVIVSLAVIAIIACAIAIPVALTAGHHHHNNNYNNFVAQRMLSNSSAQTSSPVISQPVFSQSSSGFSPFGASSFGP